MVATIEELSEALKTVDKINPLGLFVFSGQVGLLLDTSSSRLYCKSMKRGLAGRQARAPATRPAMET
jgi:hypothetical protein